MKKSIFGLCAGAMLLLFSGCAQLQVAYTNEQLNNQKLAPSGTRFAHINGQNWGLYFIKWPMVTGSVRKPGSVSWFKENSVNVPAVTGMVTAESRRLGATATLDLTSQYESNMTLLPIPFLFYIRSVNVSGNAVR